MIQSSKTMTRVSRNLSVLLRTERLIARRRMAVLRNQSALITFAALVATLGLIMLNVAGFFAMRQTMSPQGAALVTAFVDLGLAALIVWLALRMNADAELEPAIELRDLAVAELETDVEDTIAEARALGTDLRRIIRDPLGSLMPGILGTLLTLLIGGDKK
ncbi:phage holin family protein [Sedimentitalea nanhaiensis]|uniref:Holin-X, holin superfamily III n=1 Tax=Sedimentitalea nanhaiensis TaxID=999627 RepID=A0A1I7DNF7_9RHOB|nr:phage holin family protein [Sedimentitalea nanhaiensis]SFU13135.1 hypothetical protein SAMN05216236_13123 [Sedimentitalea nanhaiensis]